MTIDHCIKLYKVFVDKGNTVAAADMKQHMLTARKFKGHPFLKELEETKAPEPKAPEPETIPQPKVKKDGKKPKR